MIASQDGGIYRMIDQYGRNIDYMRISITDRCSLRCRYCMPEGVELVPMKDILSYEEIAEIVSAGVKLGITKLKITGGEPLVRRGCPDLIRSLKQIPGIEQVTMTTNGVLLEHYLPALLDAGLDAVNISLDTLNRERFEQITGRDLFVEVMQGIKAAADSSIRTKINTVLQKDINTDEILPLAGLAETYPLDVRFIEMMPIGFGAETEGVSNTEVFNTLKEHYPQLSDDSSVHGNGPAVYAHIPGWKGSIGFISAVHGKFCSSCNRIRLSAQGQIKPCLCYGDIADLRPVLRQGYNAEDKQEKLQEILYDAIFHKPQEHCFENFEKITEKNRMVKIGG